MNNLFERLRHHARSTPTSVALFSRYRPITYRKLWSRIERATARIQTEWQLQPGDVVTYCGAAHPDALLLFLAAARSGVVLWPLDEAVQARSQASAMAPMLQATQRVIYDDSRDMGVPKLEWAQADAFASLSSLIDRPCPPPPLLLLEDMHQPSLLVPQAEAPDAGLASAVSLAWLWQHHASECFDASAEKRIADHLFQPQALGAVVLPTLMAGASLLIG